MSLINQVLQDLEARRAPPPGDSSWQGEVRPVAGEVAAGGNRRWLAITAVLALAATGGYFLFGSRAVEPAALEAAGTPGPAAVIPAAPAVAPGDKGLRLAMSLDRLPAPGIAPAKALPELPSPPAKPVPPTRPEATTAVATPASIEKVPATASPRERAEGEYRKAQGLLASGRGQEAMEVLQGALRLDGEHQASRQALVNLLLQARRADEAAAVLKEGVELQPGRLAWAMSLARLQVEQGDYATAARTLARSLPQAGRSAEYLGFYGYVLQHLGQYRDAAGLYQAAAQLAPTEGRWWLGLGLAQEAAGQAPEAREAFRRAVAAGNLSADLAAVAETRAR